MTKEQVKKFNEINDKLNYKYSRLRDVDCALNNCKGLKVNDPVSFSIIFPKFNTPRVDIVFSRDNARKILNDERDKIIDEINKYEKQIEEI